MDLRQLCVKVYQETVTFALIDSELKRSLKVHERVPSFIDSLVKELRFSKAKKENIVAAVISMTNIFISSIETKARENYMSDLAKTTLRQEVERLKAVHSEAEKLADSKEIEVNEDGKTKSRSTVKV